MRMRVVRVGIAAAVAVAALGVTSPHWVLRGVLRDATRVALAPAHTAAAVGLPGAAGLGNAHDRASAADATLAPAVLLSLAVALWVLFVRTQRVSSHAVRAGGSRAPPRSRLRRSPS